MRAPPVTVPSAWATCRSPAKGDAVVVDSATEREDALVWHAQALLLSLTVVLIGACALLQ